jgi:hypothetical protein
MTTQNVWMGEFGDYLIPPEIMEKVKLTKSGWFDKRSKNTELKEWVQRMEDDSRRIDSP